MTAEERRTWDRKYRSGDVHLPEGATAILERTVDTLPDGRALDVATGFGRNARFLADHGYAVDALDVSREALVRARDRTPEALPVEWIQADVDQCALPTSTYAVAVMSYYRNLDRLGVFVDALVPVGVLVYEHPVWRPGTPPVASTHSLAPNELLREFRAATDALVLHYEETWFRAEGRPRAVLLARRPDD